MLRHQFILKFIPSFYESPICDPAPGRGISGSFFLSLSFSHTQVVIKKSSNDNFFCSKKECEWNHHHLSENFTILNKTSCLIWWLFNDDLRAREREREEKGTTNSAPKNSLIRFSYCTGFHGFGNQNTWQWTIKFDLKKRLLIGLKYIFLKNSIAMVWAFRGQNFLVKSLKMYLRLTYILPFLQFLIQRAETCAYLNG